MATSDTCIDCGARTDALCSVCDKCHACGSADDCEGLFHSDSDDEDNDD
jgi:hypothetical protein